MESERRTLWRAIGKFEAATGDADMGMFIHKIQKSAERILMNDRVRVQ
jgi:hypothetical protein